jgi:hypothetical protein
VAHAPCPQNIPGDAVWWWRECQLGRDGEALLWAAPTLGRGHAAFPRPMTTRFFVVPYPLHSPRAVKRASGRGSGARSAHHHLPFWQLLKLHAHCGAAGNRGCRGTCTLTGLLAASPCCDLWPASLTHAHTHTHQPPPPLQPTSHACAYAQLCVRCSASSWVPWSWCFAAAAPCSSSANPHPPESFPPGPTHTSPGAACP